MPELSEKLEKFQDECADVLAAAFLPQEKQKRKPKRIGKGKTTIALYSGKDFYILKIGEDFYDLDIDEFTELNSLIPMLLYKDIGQIPEIIRTYLSFHEESSPKLTQEWTAECDE